MSATTATVTEAMESLTGFDEIAIEKHMGYDVYTQPETGNTRPMTLMRSLVFVYKRRDGLNDVEARKACLDMTAGQVNDYFADDPEEIDPDDPETEAGKDD